MEARRIKRQRERREVAREGEQEYAREKDAGAGREAGGGWYHEESVKMEGAREERKRGREREGEKWRAFVCLFGRRTLNTWSRCTHGSYGSRLEKIKNCPLEEWRGRESAPARGKRMTHRVKQETETKGDSGRLERGRRRGGEGTLSRMLYCFCVRSRWERDGAEGADERRGERDGRYRLLEICIFVGHTSLPR